METYMKEFTADQQEHIRRTEVGTALLAQEARAVLPGEAEQEQLDIAQANQLFGMLQYGQFLDNVNRLTLLKTLAELKARKAYRGLVVPTPEGGTVCIKTWEQLCAACGLSRSAVEEDLQNMAVFGEKLLEAQSKMGVGYRQLRGLRGTLGELSEDKKLEVRQLIDDAVASGDKENLLATLEEIGSRNRKLAEQVEQARADAEDARKLKSAYLDAKIRAEDELQRLKNPRNESEAEELLRNRRVALLREVQEASAKIIGYSLKLATLVQKDPQMGDVPVIDGATMEALNMEISKMCQIVRDNLLSGGYDVDFAAQFEADPMDMMENGD